MRTSPPHHSSAVSTTKTTARPSVILATLAAIAIGLAVCATAATVIVASDVTRERERAAVLRDASTPQSLGDARAQLEGLQSMGSLIDSLVASLAPFSDADSVNTALMVHLWTGQRNSHPVWERLPKGVLPAGTPVVQNARLNVLASDTTLDSEFLSRSASDTLSPWLAIWRQHARSAPLPPMWGYRDKLPGVASALDLPSRHVSGIRTLVMLNELAGRLALRAGDAASAAERGLENVAASRHYLDSPFMLDFAVGKMMVLRGSRLVAEAAELAGHRDVAMRARELERLATPGLLAFRVLSREADRDAADPNSPMAMELFDDEKLPFAVRVEVLYAVVRGACNHTREVIFGFAPERQQQLAALAARHRHHPVLGPVLGLMPGAAQRLRENPQSVIPAGQFPTSGTFDFLLPEAMAARAVACQSQF